MTVVDVFGEPIRAAKVSPNAGRDTLTDVNGVARFSHARGEVVASAYGVDKLDWPVLRLCICISANVSTNQHVEMHITALPTANPVIGSATAANDAVEVSADGRPDLPLVIVATVALPMDQRRRIVANDPSNLRLFGTKYLKRNPAGDALLLAAFAADDITGAALIDDRPVTVVATDASTSSFQAIDDLATREGGASPLYAAIDETIGLIAANPSTTAQRRVVVALTDGRDDTCGTADQCRAARQAIMNKSAANDIDIVTLVLPGGTEYTFVADLNTTHVGDTTPRRTMSP